MPGSIGGSARIPPPMRLLVPMVAVWRAGRPKTDLNFPEVESQPVAEWLVPQGIRMEEMPTKKRPAVVVAPGESDEAAMAWFARFAICCKAISNEMLFATFLNRKIIPISQP